MDFKIQFQFFFLRIEEKLKNNCKIIELLFSIFSNFNQSTIFEFWKLKNFNFFFLKKFKNFKIEVSQLKLRFFNSDWETSISIEKLQFLGASILIDDISTYIEEIP